MPRFKRLCPFSKYKEITYEHVGPTYTPLPVKEREIFNGCNLTVLKYKFGTLPSDSESAAIFFFFRSGLPDSTVNEEIDALANLLKYYFDNSIDAKR